MKGTLADRLVALPSPSHCAEHNYMSMIQRAGPSARTSRIVRQLELRQSMQCEMEKTWTSASYSAKLVEFSSLITLLVCQKLPPNRETESVEPIVLDEMLHLIETILSWMKSRIEQGLLITFFVLRQRFCSRTSLAMIASSGAMYRRSDPNLFLTPSILHPKANPAMFRPTLQPRKWEAWASSHNNLRPQLRLQLLGLRRYTEIGVG